MSRQLRASCNACNRAKVKCSKTQPKCARCKKNGYAECVYGISLRAGKRTNTQATAQSLHESSASPRERETESSKPQSQSAMSISIPNNNNVSSANYSSMDDMDIIGNGLISGLLEFDPSYGLEHDSMSDSMSHSLSFDQCSTFSSHLGTPLQESHQHQLPIPPHVFGDRSSRGNSFITDATNGFSSFCHRLSDDSKPHACQCFPAVLETLSGLHQLSGTRSVSFDVALARNKEAAAICSEAMKCNCTPHCMAVMIFSSLITNIVAIYQVPRSGWVASCPPSSSPGQKTSSISSTSSTSSSVSNSVRFTLGAYILDEEIEERFKTEIVRVGLQRVESLIAKLKEKYCSHRRYRPDHEDEMYEALMVFLTEKVKGAFEMLPSV